MSRDVSMNSNPPTKEPPLWDIIPEPSSNSDGIQEEVAESLNTKQLKKLKTTAGASTITKENSF